MNTSIENVLNIWESKNKILQPVKKVFYFDYIDQMAGLFSAGSFYYYIFDFERLEMELVHNDIKTLLGISPEEFSLEKLFDIMHPEDSEKMYKRQQKVTDFLFTKISKEEIPQYKVVYLIRLKDTNGNYKTILHQSVALVLSKRGKIQKILGIHTDVSYLNTPIDHTISFISRKLPSYHSLENDSDFTLIENNCQKKLTQREQEILKLLAEGRDLNYISEVLYISPHTVKTHKRNILRKSECRNITEIVARCIREGVI